MPAEWIVKFRQKYELSQEQLGKMAGCSAELIDLLENMNGCITHPNIANRLADVCGATGKQRDRIVHKKHRGRYEPTPGRRYTGAAKQAKKKDEKPMSRREMYAVVKIDPQGEIIERYTDAEEAAARNGHSATYIRARCNHKLSAGSDEFKPYEESYRYAREWDAYSPQERRARVQRAPFLDKRKKYEWQGQAHTIAEWAQLAGMPAKLLRNRLCLGWDIGRAMTEPIRGYTKV